MKGSKCYHQTASLFLSTVILMIALAGCKENADEPAKVERRKAEHAAPITTKCEIPEENLRIPEDMQTCAANLHKIYAAIKEYEKDKGKLPEWLSDLVPDYLSSEQLFCPSDGSHKSAFPPDPKLPGSYGWQFSAKPIPTSWDATGRTLYRDWKTQQVELLGDVVPMVRCYHHDSKRILNLSVGGQIWWGPPIWEPMLKPDYASIHKQMLSKIPTLHKADPVPLGSVPSHIEEVSGESAIEGAISSKDVENTPEDYLSGSVLINASDGIYSLDLKTGQKSRFFRESGSIEMHDNEIYIFLAGRRAIYVKSIEGKILRSFQLPKEVAYSTNFAVLPDGRIAISDNKNDRVYFVDESGKHLKTVELLEIPNSGLQNMHLIVAKDKLIVSENGFKEIVQIDLSSYEVSLLRRLAELRPWLGAIDYDKGMYYICDNKNMYSFAEDSEEVRLIATVPQNNITGIKIVGEKAFVIVNGVGSRRGEATKYSGALYRVDLKTGEVSTIIEELARPKDMEIVPASKNLEKER